MARKMIMQSEMLGLQSRFWEYAVPIQGTLIIYHRGWTKLSELFYPPSPTKPSSARWPFGNSVSQKLPSKKSLKANTRRAAKQRSCISVISSLSFHKTNSPKEPFQKKDFWTLFLTLRLTCNNRMENQHG